MIVPYSSVRQDLGILGTLIISYKLIWIWIPIRKGNTSICITITNLGSVQSGHIQLFQYNGDASKDMDSPD